MSRFGSLLLTSWRSRLTINSFTRISKPAAYHSSPIRNVFVNVEVTPNPQSLKFLPGKEVLPETYGTGMYFEKANSRELLKSPLATKLLKLPGLKSVFFGKDFITVTKDTDYQWVQVKPMIYTQLLDFFTGDELVIDDSHQAEASDTQILDSDSDIVAAIKELMETRVRPSVQEDGGDIFYVGFEPSTGMVKVRLAGSCVGCPSSSVTLRNGVENMLMHYIPEVKGIEEVTEASEAFNANEVSQEGEMKLNFKPEFTPTPQASS